MHMSPVVSVVPKAKRHDASKRRFWRPALASLALAGIAWGTATTTALANCTDTPEGRVCTQQHPLVSGALVDTVTQRNLGLVTINTAIGSCSGTLLNQYWVLTAEHCVTSPASGNRVSATWTGATATASGVVRYRQTTGLDVALLYLGMGDLGPTNIQLFYVQEVERGMRLIKYGRGVSGFATSGPPPVRAEMDGRYRSAVFMADSGGDRYVLPANSSGQVGSGGDSGGPDIVLASNGVGLGIAGVTSNCSPTGYVPDRPEDWNWATGISECRSAALHPIRHDIVMRIQQTPLLERTGNDVVLQNPGVRVPRSPDLTIQLPSQIPRQ